jgi:esterase/lipase superfamily enzyme
MLQGTYYREWSRYLDCNMEFKVYGQGGVPALAFPCRGGRFYDWENSGMPDAVAPLLREGKLQLFCADSIDGESLLAGDVSLRRQAEMQEKYFNYITQELAPRILALNRAANAAAKPAAAASAEKADEAKTGKAKEAEAAPVLWCVGADLGAYHAVNLRLRRPALFAGAIALSGEYGAFGDRTTDDLALRNSPLAYLAQPDFFSAEARAALASAPDSLILCAGQGAYEGEALASTQALDAALQAAGFAAHTEIWGGDVSHDWYWWGKEWALFAQRLFG